MAVNITFKAIEFGQTGSMALRFQPSLTLWTACTAFDCLVNFCKAHLFSTDFQSIVLCTLEFVKVLFENVYGAEIQMTWPAKHTSTQLLSVSAGLLAAGPVAALGAQDLLFAGSSFSDPESVISSTL